MTDQLTGRALDEACAKAMGWRDIGDDADGCQCGLPPERAAGVYRRRFVPAFSTDAACIPEMLAWLRSKTYIECDGCPLPLEVVDLGNEYEASIGAEGDDIARVWAHGDTLSEALAKLVAAVGDAKRNAE